MDTHDRVALMAAILHACGPRVETGGVEKAVRRARQLDDETSKQLEAVRAADPMAGTLSSDPRRRFSSLPSEALFRRAIGVPAARPDSEVP